MATHRLAHRLSQLWQLPLLILSLALFAYASYLFIDPRPGLSIDQKIALAAELLQQDRPDAAIEQLNKLLRIEKLHRDKQGRIHLMLAEALDDHQRQKRISIPAYHQMIVEQTRYALAMGATPQADTMRRLGESFEALNFPREAVEHYRQAMALDPSRALPLRRKVIELQLAVEDFAPADASLTQYLRDEKISDSERAWALGEQARLMIDREKFVEARNLLNEALRLETEAVNQGQIHFRLGQIAWKLGDPAEAERLLRVARDQLRLQHPLDADACCLLGQIYQDRNDPATASSFYQVVLVSHPDSKIAPLAQLGRGLCRIMLDEDEAGLSDLHELRNQIENKPSRRKYRDAALAGFKTASQLLLGKANYQGAVEVMAHEQALQPQPAANFFARLAAALEKRAEQVEKTIPDAVPAEKIRREQQVRDVRIRAGDAYVAYSRALTLSDDKGYGEAMWRGIDLYDRAANLQCVVAALELFVAERPEDQLAPEALLRLGNALQAAGMLDRAISAYQRNQIRYPNTLAASRSAVPLAQAYIAKGPEAYAKAESVLLGVVENNPLLTPQAEEFRHALFELAQLFYRTSRFEPAIARLEEWTQRYPSDERFGQALFLTADCYRKSAGIPDMTASAANDASQAVAAATARRERLNKARELYARFIERFGAVPPASGVDKLYHKLAHFYRADCAYDLGNFEEAIRLYDEAALRYQDDASALAAYVQIVNAYFALGRPDDARTANERAKWLLRRMPADSFADGTFAMPKAYWEQWLKWTGDAGMW